MRRPSWLSRETTSFVRALTVALRRTGALVDKYDPTLHNGPPPGMQDESGRALLLVQAQTDLKDEAKSHTRTDAVESCFEISDDLEASGHKLTGGTRGLRVGELDLLKQLGSLDASGCPSLDRRAWRRGPCRARLNAESARTAAGHHAADPPPNGPSHQLRAHAALARDRLCCPAE